MAMGICNKCLENNWKFEKLDGFWIKAICQQCGNEVEWESKKLNKLKIEKEGDLCRKCKIPVIMHYSKFNKKKLKKAYYYNQFLQCPKCRHAYYQDKYKIINKDVCQRNIKASLID